MRIPSLTCCQLCALPRLSIFTSLAPEQIHSLSSKQPVASGEGALECSAGVWDITAQLPGLPQTPAAGWEGQNCSSSSRWGWHPWGDTPAPWLEAQRRPSIQDGRKRLLPWEYRLQLQWGQVCSKLSQNELLQQRFCLQVEGKNKSCGKPHDFYLEQIFFGCWKFSWRTHRGKGMTLPSSVRGVMGWGTLDG